MGLIKEVVAKRYSDHFCIIKIEEICILDNMVPMKSSIRYNIHNAMFLIECKRNRWKND